MSYPSFFIYLSIISFVAAILALLQLLLPSFAAYSAISWISIATFAALSIIMYFATVAAMKNEDSGKFIGVFMGFTLIKMVLSVCIVLLYFRLTNPATNLFVFPFFIIYLIYTSFEVWFMTQLGKTKKS